jgi:hypothetical protein
METPTQTPTSEIFLATPILLSEQSGKSFVDQIIPQYNFIHDHYKLPDPVLIFKDNGFIELQSQRLDYINSLVLVAQKNSISIKDIKNNPGLEKFFKDLPNIGVYHPDSTSNLFSNSGKLGTSINRAKYNSSAYCVDFTIELVRALVDKSFPGMDNEQLSQKSVASLFSPAMIQSPIYQLGTKNFSDLFDRHFKYHQEISQPKSA